MGNDLSYYQRVYNYKSSSEDTSWKSADTNSFICCDVMGTTPEILDQTFNMFFKIWVARTTSNGLLQHPQKSEIYHNPWKFHVSRSLICLEPLFFTSQASATCETHRRLQPWRNRLHLVDVVLPGAPRALKTSGFNGDRSSRGRAKSRWCSAFGAPVGSGEVRPASAMPLWPSATTEVQHKIDQTLGKLQSMIPKY